MKHEDALAALLERPPENAIAPEELVKGLGDTQVWTNQLGSTATLTIDSYGNVTGTYKSTVSSTGKTIEGPIKGWYKDYIITFSVTWPTSPPAMTTWIGAFVKANTYYDLDTLWQLVTQSKTTDPRLFWTAINAGADHFTTPSKAS